MEAFFASPWFWLGLIIFLLGLLVVESFHFRRTTAIPKRKSGPRIEEKVPTFNPSTARTVKKPRS